MSVRTIPHAARDARHEEQAEYLRFEPGVQRGLFRNVARNVREESRPTAKYFGESRGTPDIGVADVPKCPGHVPRSAPAPAGIVRPPSETTAMVAARLSPRRGELFEFAVHGAPRSFHPVDSRREPSECRDQSRNVDPRRAPDGAIHIHLRIRNTSQSLYVHEAPPGVTALEILRQPPPPEAAKLQASCHNASFCLIHSIFARTDFYCACISAGLTLRIGTATYDAR